MKKMFDSMVMSVLILCAASSGCAVEDASNDETSRQEAREIAELALDDYLVCQETQPNECASERDELEAALDELDVSLGNVAFRGGAVADCAGGTTVTCSGASCTSADNVGCACSSGGMLTSVGACPQK